MGVERSGRVPELSLAVGQRLNAAAAPHKLLRVVLLVVGREVPISARGGEAEGVHAERELVSVRSSRRPGHVQYICWIWLMSF